MPLKSRVGVTTVAVVSRDAVNILFFGQVILDAILDLVVGFNSGSGSKCPAGTATSLVSHGSDGNIFPGVVLHIRCE